MQQQAIQLQRDDDGESSFHFISLTSSDQDLPSPRRFPIFDGYKSLFTIQDPIQDDDHEKLAALGDQFRSLFVGDDERDPSSSSEEEEDEPAALEGATSGNFCVWRPKRVAGSESPTGGWCRKSRSTGSAPTNWLRLKDLFLRRSNSDGKVKFLDNKMAAAEKKRATTKKKVSSPQEVFYVRTKALREEERRKTFLPYRRDLIGIFH